MGVHHANTSLRLVLDTDEIQFTLCDACMCCEFLCLRYQSLTDLNKGVGSSTKEVLKRIDWAGCLTLLIAVGNRVVVSSIENQTFLRSDLFWPFWV